MILTKTVIAAGAGLLMHAGAGCFSPTIIEDNGEVVTLKYGPWATIAEVQSKAQDMCKAYDRSAELVADFESELEPSFRYATFDCILQEPPVA